jgi:SAM-dependent methyltransferase
MFIRFIVLILLAAIMASAMLSSSAAQRNRGPILEILRRHLPATGAVLELASGSGEHVTHFAAAFPALVFQPSDPDPQARASIAERVAQSGLSNVRAPQFVDASADDWTLPAEIAASLAAIVCINMIHISPWSAALGVLRGAGKLLPADGVLFLYGPYRRGGRHTAPSNDAFDRDLRARNADWGVRNVEDVVAEGAAQRLALAEIVEMPANNLSVVLRHRANLV